MQLVEPEVHLIAETKIDMGGMRNMLDSLGAKGYHIFRNADSRDDNHAEALIEVCGRMCYKSFDTKLNPNVTKTRNSTGEYIQNILEVKHGSVVEQADVSFAFLNVSRIFTHEKVRHRAGTAFSQESMRFMRITEIPIWLPPSLEVGVLMGKPYDIALEQDRVPYKASGDGRLDTVGSATVRLNREEWAHMIRDEFINRLRRICEQYEEAATWMEDMMGLDGADSFDHKKIYTSALRRMMPGGVATNIIVKGNHRAWRWIIEQRSTVHAEEEIREVFYKVGAILKTRFPHLYEDMHESLVAWNGIQVPVWYFQNSKV